ncbi:hypothetical protein J437_LFUL006432 [Ladona fulva]|uniref:Uncharacterized protein n=1 Tax=Ladona fulva TaxID=123851 RepID=A0A8K0NX45_LADFU|nr:hypothetical protein J437_LFUL006432 [Ladona fulva]
MAVDGGAEEALPDPVGTAILPIRDRGSAAVGGGEVSRLHMSRFCLFTSLAVLPEQRSLKCTLVGVHREMYRAKRKRVRIVRVGSFRTRTGEAAVSRDHRFGASMERFRGSACFSVV